MLASVKLEDVDINSAVRLLFSDDRLASPDESIYVRRSPTSAPCSSSDKVDRRLLPISSCFISHLQLSVWLSNHSVTVRQLPQTVFGHNTSMIYYSVYPIDDSQLLVAVILT